MLRKTLIMAATALALTAMPALGQDPALRQPGRSEVARSLYAERNHDERSPRERLRRPHQRGKDLAIGPGLAERWEVAEPTRWRFYLRKGVKFQNGDDFTADDVIFSAERVRAAGFELPDPRSQGCEVREGRRLHGRRGPARRPIPILNYAVGHLVHHVQEVGGGEQRRRAHAGRGNDAELRRAERQRHRPLQDREPPARREDGLQAEPRLVGQARA